jgi:hypothetical protein
MFPKCRRAEIEGKPPNLGRSHHEATRKCYELMAERPKPPSQPQLQLILDKFLDWVQVHRPNLHRWYRDCIESVLSELKRR